MPPLVCPSGPQNQHDHLLAMRQTCREQDQNEQNDIGNSLLYIISQPWFGFVKHRPISNAMKCVPSPKGWSPAAIYENCEKKHKCERRPPSALVFGYDELAAPDLQRRVFVCCAHATIRINAKRCVKQLNVSCKTQQSHWKNTQPQTESHFLHFATQLLEFSRCFLHGLHFANANSDDKCSECKSKCDENSDGSSCSVGSVAVTNKRTNTSASYFCQ